MSLDIRYLPEQSPEEIIRQIEGLQTGAVHVHAQGMPVKTPVDDPYVQRLALVAARHTRSGTKLFGQHGSADTTFFSGYGIPAVEFGPIGGDWHGAGEYVDIASVERYKRILVEFVLGFNQELK